MNIIINLKGRKGAFQKQNSKTQTTQSKCRHSAPRPGNKQYTLKTDKDSPKPRFLFDKQ